jgi:hypothetical protein
MLGLGAIRAMNKEAVRKAKANKTQPYIAKCDNDKGVFSCPKLGDHIPKGWVYVTEYFVDSSGFGSESEPALTPEQFQAKVKEGMGYAISDEGQFQLYVREYKRRVK